MTEREPDPRARIAVVIPCFNDGSLVDEAASSVAESEPVEIVIVNDGSTDAATLAALERLRGDVRVLDHAGNRGVAAARNTGLAETDADYVFPLDADDLACPGMLAAMADRLAPDPSLDVCYGDYAEFGLRTRIRDTPAWLDPFRIAYRNLYPPSALFRRSALEAISGWTWPDNYEDWSLWMSLAERGARTIHMGRGVITYRHRSAHGRRLEAGRRQHRQLHRALRAAHPLLFQRIREHRVRSDLSALEKWFYPLRPLLPRPALRARFGPLLRAFERLSAR